MFNVEDCLRTSCLSDVVVVDEVLFTALIQQNTRSFLAPFFPSYLKAETFPNCDFLLVAY